MKTPAIRRSPEQVVTKLENQLASSSPARHARAALKSIDKASAAFEDAASREALGKARAALEAWLARPRVAAPSVAPDATQLLALAKVVAKAIETPLQARIESFAVDLADLIKRSMIEAVERALELEPGTWTAVEERIEIPADEPVSLELYEKKALLQALAETKGDRLAAAKLLNIGKSTLYRMVRKHGIK